MSRCYYCKVETTEGTIRCKDCKDANHSARVAFKGTGWAAQSNPSRLKRWNGNKPDSMKTNDLSHRGMC